MQRWVYVCNLSLASHSLAPIFLRDSPRHGKHSSSAFFPLALVSSLVRTFSFPLARSRSACSLLLPLLYHARLFSSPHGTPGRPSDVHAGPPGAARLRASAACAPLLGHRAPLTQCPRGSHAQRGARCALRHRCGECWGRWRRDCHERGVAGERRVVGLEIGSGEEGEKKWVEEDALFADAPAASESEIPSSHPRPVATQTPGPPSSPSSAGLLPFPCILCASLGRVAERQEL